MRWPGAIALMVRFMKLRAGTRCTMALTVVSTMVGMLARRQSQLGQRRHAAGDDVGAGADAVVRHRVPGRKGDDPHVRREEGQRLLQLLHAPVIARNVQQRAGGRARIAPR